MNKPWSEDFDELDMHVSKLISSVSGSFLPTFAIAAALIDAGVLSRARLLEIITAVHDLATAHALVGEAEDQLEVLERFSDWLEELPLAEGTTLEQLRGYAAMRSFLDLRARRKPPE